MVFRFESVAAFSAALAETTGSLPMPEGESVRDGEWVLSIFEIGSRRRATAAAARGVRAAGDVHLEFERRDWDRLVAFVAARSEHMRAAKPVSTSSPPEMATTPAPESAPVSDVPPSSRMSFGARVLVLDHDAATREDVRTVLAEIGLEVEIARHPTDARARIEARAFDAIVLDYDAAGVELLAFVRELRRDPVRGPTPVLMLSSASSSRDVVEAFASGADDFLAKPFRAPELGARVFGLLRRARLARLAASGSPR